MTSSSTSALIELEQRIGPRFARSEARMRALAYLRGLLSPAERKNSWQLAEMLGDATPYGTPSASICWVVRIGMQMPCAMICTTPRRVVDHLDDPEAILVVDETGFLKKGRHSVGVARHASSAVARLDELKIARLASSWPMLANVVTP